MALLPSCSISNKGAFVCNPVKWGGKVVWLVWGLLARGAIKPMFDSDVRSAHEDMKQQHAY